MKTPWGLLTTRGKVFVLIGAVVVAVMHVLPFGKDEGEGAAAH